MGGWKRKFPFVMQKSTARGSHGVEVGLGGMGVSVGRIMRVDAGESVGVSVGGTSGVGTVETTCGSVLQEANRATTSK